MYRNASKIDPVDTTKDGSGLLTLCTGLNCRRALWSLMVTLITVGSTKTFYVRKKLRHSRKSSANWSAVTINMVRFQRVAPQLEAEVFTKTDGVDAFAICCIKLDVIWQETEDMRGSNLLIRS